MVGKEEKNNALFFKRHLIFHFIFASKKKSWQWLFPSFVEQFFRLPVTQVCFDLSTVNAKIWSSFSYTWSKNNNIFPSTFVRATRWNWLTWNTKANFFTLIKYCRCKLTLLEKCHFFAFFFSLIFSQKKGKTVQDTNKLKSWLRFFFLDQFWNWLYEQCIFT